MSRHLEDYKMGLPATYKEIKDKHFPYLAKVSGPYFPAIFVFGFQNYPIQSCLDGEHVSRVKMDLLSHDYEAWRSVSDIEIKSKAVHVLNAPVVPGFKKRVWIVATGRRSVEEFPFTRLEDALARADALAKELDLPVVDKASPPPPPPPPEPTFDVRQREGMHFLVTGPVSAIRLNDFCIGYELYLTPEDRSFRLIRSPGGWVKDKAYTPPEKAS